MVDMEQQYVCIVCFCCVCCLLHTCVAWFHIQLSTDKYWICMCVCVCVCTCALIHVPLHSNNIFSFFILEYLGYFFFSHSTHKHENTHLSFFHSKKYLCNFMQFTFQNPYHQELQNFHLSVTKWPTLLKAFEKYIYIWVFSLLLEENILITYMWLNMSHSTQ
jgi:hypothetical protein